jgi:phosphoglycerate kinase
MAVDFSTGVIRDDLRIIKTLPTIKFLRDAGAILILISHIEGKESTATNGTYSLEPVVNHINKKYAAEFGATAEEPIAFVKDYLTTEGILETKKLLLNSEPGDVIIFENLRMDAGEKKNDIEFAKKLAQYADIYVNDGFAVSHREHASVVALPSLLPHYAGLQLMKELENLSKVFNPPRPFVFILGGAKFSTKLPLINKYMEGKNAADSVFLCGALLNDILKAQGLSVGKSLVSKEPVDLSSVVINPKLVTPDDVTVGDKSVKPIDAVGADDIIMDVGPSFIEKLKESLKTAQFVLWNGPTGNYEAGFTEQTLAVAQAIIEAGNERGVQAVLGGGDTTAALGVMGLDNEAAAAKKAPHMFVSTGGGAMLEYLQNETLPGMEALK